MIEFLQQHARGLLDRAMLAGQILSGGITERASQSPEEDAFLEETGLISQLRDGRKSVMAMLDANHMEARP